MNKKKHRTRVFKFNSEGAKYYDPELFLKGIYKKIDPPKERGPRLKITKVNQEQGTITVESFPDPKERKRKVPDPF